MSAPRTGGSFFRRKPLGVFRLTGWRRFAGVLVPLALAGGAIFASPTASAVPSPSVSDVKKKVEKLQDEADQAAEAHAETREKLKSTRVKLNAAKKELKKQEGRVQTLKEQVGLLAAESYRRGELSALDVMLSDDPESALAQAGYLPSLSSRQSGALNNLADAQKKLEDTKKSMEEQVVSIEKSKKKMEKDEKLAKERLNEAKQELNTLEAAQRTTVNNALGNGGMPSDKAGGTCTAAAAAAPSAAAKAAINFACSKQGDSYVWAAAGPTTWDCSGLTMKAYAAGGVSLPHSSGMQAGYGTSVSTGSLLPGDLVFFNSPISHVGIYLGNNTMVHAPSSGDVVKVATLWKAPVAAARLG
ncbi:C40 family peptidase [Kineosporia babensis]|uniref:NlpC/P60 family protein n=1 Tax=Kineosporia babensis TaxID=499548 RepID=A0A9X1NCE7_9ACTN|nr:NlpC/P60 family protein [Kineosporia babensis]